MNAIQKLILGSPEKTDPDYCVYELRKGNKVYVGVTKRPSAREREHRKNKSKINIFGSTPDGEADFDFIKVVENVDWDLASTIEQDLIAAYRQEGDAVLNITGGGECQNFYGHISENNIRYCLQKHGFNFGKLQKIVHRINDDDFAPIADDYAEAWMLDDTRNNLFARLNERLIEIYAKVDTGEMSKEEFTKIANTYIAEYLNSSEYIEAFNEFLFANDSTAKNDHR